MVRTYRKSQQIKKKIYVKLVYSALRKRSSLLFRLHYKIEIMGCALRPPSRHTPRGLISARSVIGVIK